MQTSHDAVPPETPEEVRARAEQHEARTPQFDPTCGITVEVAGRTGTPPHRLVVLGDSLSQGFQSGAVLNTDLSWPAVVAHELGWSDRYRFPVYGGPGGLPMNLELLLRRLEERFGRELSFWEVPMALFAARSFMDEVEDYWERGPGSRAPRLDAYNHDLAVYGWNLRDVLSRTAKLAEKTLDRPNDAWLNQVVENDSQRAALRVYPHWNAATEKQTLLDAAAALGADHDAGTEAGIETLVVLLGANNALPTVTKLAVRWSGDDFRDLDTKGKYTVWRPEHFAAELAEVVAAVRRIKARHVIWCTVPHVTIAPIARGIGGKLRPGSRYFPYYARPWVRDEQFDARRDANITGAQARAVDATIDLYNEGIEQAVSDARSGTDGVVRDWLLLDLAGLLDRLAARRYIADPNARPSWWTPYPLPPVLAALDPPLDSRFLTADGRGGRATGGLFSLDGVHPTTVAYGLIAQEVMSIQQRAGVTFYDVTGHERPAPVLVDFHRLLRRDTLVLHPPQNINSTLDALGWADEHLGWVTRALT